MIAAAAIAKSAPAMPIEIGPGPLSEDEASLIVRQRRCQAPPNRIAGDFLPQRPLPSWRYLFRLL
jgi:hypothetical protein